MHITLRATSEEAVQRQTNYVYVCPVKMPALHQGLSTIAGREQYKDYAESQIADEEYRRCMTA